MTTTPNHPDEIPPRPDEDPDTQPAPGPADGGEPTPSDVEPDPGPESGSSFSAPSEGLADPTAGQTGPVAPKPDAGEESVPDAPDDDVRTHEADFSAAGGYDDRQADGMPGAARPTPEEYVEEEGR